MTTKIVCAQNQESTAKIPWTRNMEGGLGKLNAHRIYWRDKGSQQATYLASLCEYIAEWRVLSKRRRATS